MINCNFVNYEEQLFHVIRTRTTTFEDYKDVVEKIGDINPTDSSHCCFQHTDPLPFQVTALLFDSLSRFYDSQHQIAGYFHISSL